ncbi:MFS transporter [Streptomyces mangrovisoli]|uniref:MFS transporter n=1 Tax=Streptomyces mangrovisoli TaxID=1428628 RepID=UPI0009A0A972|nr:MFS transporter [Streptomyces mangrovisoli]
MISVLRNPVYRRLLVAQVVALVGTGLATVALGLLAYDLAGADAGSVLGTALAVKMAAYVTIAPAAGALARRLPRRALLVSADLVRAAAALTLPFVDQVWQVYVLIFLLQSASAVFTPVFQSVVPDVLPAERDYTRALSLSRLAYDLESLFSPALAAALLSLIAYNWLFLGTVAGFLGSAALVVSAVLPKRVAGADDAVRADSRRSPRTATGRGTHAEAASGVRLFLSTPRLRALLALDLAVAAAGAVVTVNSVVYVRDALGRSAGDVPLALGAYGGGSMAVALLLPRVLERVPDRTVMLRGALVLSVVFAGLAALTAARDGDWRWPALLLTWAAFGAGCSMVLTPTGRLIRDAAPPELRASAFAAQFSLSHGCWLLTYPLAGWLGAAGGLESAVVVLGAVAAAAGRRAARLWPAEPARVPAVPDTRPAPGGGQAPDTRPAPYTRPAPGGGRRDVAPAGPGSRGGRRDAAPADPGSGAPGAH